MMGHVILYLNCDTYRPETSTLPKPRVRILLITWYTTCHKVGPGAIARWFSGFGQFIFKPSSNDSMHSPERYQMPTSAVWKTCSLLNGDSRTLLSLYSSRIKPRDRPDHRQGSLVQWYFVRRRGFMGQIQTNRCLKDINSTPTILS